MKGKLGLWLQAIRPATLSAGAAPVLLGTALAASQGALVPKRGLDLLGLRAFGSSGVEFC
jgi:1,4-dihydroxy-2-naphthoate octaprenyltransferase